MLVHYGFMDEPNVMRALAQCRLEHFPINLMETSFFIGREKLRLRSRRRLAFGRFLGPELFVFLAWRDRLFIFLNNLALDATEFFRIPPNRGFACSAVSRARGPILLLCRPGAPMK